MPLPISISHRISRAARRQVRKDGRLDYLRPDGKTQVTIATTMTTSRSIDTVVVSSQHAAT
jgi:S-adenosylmethionine synthetase